MELICLLVFHIRCDALLLAENLNESGNGFALVVIMENIYKIRVKSNPSPLSVYPSERRYSASTVLGLGVVHLALATTTLLLASLTLTTSKEAIVSTGFTENTTQAQEVTVLMSNDEPEGNKTSEEMLIVTTAEPLVTPDLTITTSTTLSELNNNETYKSRSRRDLKSTQYYTNISIAPCVMTLGSLLAGVSALLAWKRWYIDNNIKWFFISSCTSVLTSLVCLLLTALTVSAAGDFDGAQFSYDFPNGPSKPPNFSLVVAVNILIASTTEVIWSILSAKIAYKGMISNYPEDIVISKCGGRTEVYTVRKGNKKVKMIPPDLINHFPNSGKLAKYLPKKDTGNLPKEESSKEYRERVNKFLTEQNDASTENKN